ILKTKASHPIAKLAQSGRGRSAGQTAANHYDLEFSPVVWTHQARMISMTVPFLSERSRRNFRMWCTDHTCGAGFISRSRMRTGLRECPARGSHAKIGPLKTGRVVRLSRLNRSV